MAARRWLQRQQLLLLQLLLLLLPQCAYGAGLDLLLGARPQQKREPKATQGGSAGGGKAGAGGAAAAAAAAAAGTTAQVKKKKPVNILLMLADDLGYADTSVHPFVGSGIRTPELERMAARGMIMTNFHTAAATCTPTRASILTGMYPWRMGIKGVFEYGEKSKPGEEKRSNRDDFLPQLPTVAMAFKDHNYSTGHSGKW